MATPALDEPGMTRYPNGVSAVIQPYTGIGGLQGMLHRNVVLLATAVITEENIFSNGLFQNVYYFYRMFEAMGWLPLLFVNRKPDDMSKVPSYMRDLRLLCVEDLAKHPIPVKLYLEIGMSIDGQMRKFLRMCGAKICKLYLGNILNIDIETPIFYPQMHFAHHVIGELDDIWVSPHYYHHSEYARALNHIDVEKAQMAAVPYIWDSQILTKGGERQFQWKAPDSEEKETFLILEPNISFQKCSLVPLMMLEVWFRQHPSWKGEVIVINGERLLLIPFFREVIWNKLDIVKAGRVKMKGRMDILTILNDYPSAIPICHQWNNEYNYMVLEYFSAGFPVLHNASDWKEFGYYYENSNLQQGAIMLEKIRVHHRESMEVYKSHARALTWRHSPYNPDVQRAWASVVG